VGFLRTRLIPWSNIDHFALIGGTARVFRRTGAPVMVAGLSAGSRWSGRSEAADHVEALTEMLQHRRPMPESSIQATA
jgi:phosphotransacetylase